MEDCDESFHAARNVRPLTVVFYALSLCVANLIQMCGRGVCVCVFRRCSSLSASENSDPTPALSGFRTFYRRDRNRINYNVS